MTDHTRAIFSAEQTAIAMCEAFPQPIRTAPVQAERPSRDVPRPVRSEAGAAGDSVRTRQ